MPEVSDGPTGCGGDDIWDVESDDDIWGASAKGLSVVNNPRVGRAGGDMLNDIDRL